VRTHAEILAGDSAGSAEAKSSATVAVAVADRDAATWVERHLRPLVGLAENGEIGRDRQAEAFAAWTRFLEGVAAETPLVLALEDVQWADEALLDFVEHLAGRDGRARLLLVTTGRPELLERRPEWAGVMRLPPLADHEVGQLLAARLREALPDATRAAVVERAAGNPLYAEEYVRMVSDRRLLRNNRRDLPLPETVQGLIAARLDAVPRPDKEIIQRAAVVGEVFWPGALEALSGKKEESVARSLAVLESRELIRRERRSSLAGEAKYVFRHVLVRDVAYGQITRAGRARTHRLTAEWIDKVAPDRAEDKADLLAHHYSRALEFASLSGGETAGLQVRARLALRAAGARAASLHALAAAARHYAAALELWPENDQGRAELLLEPARARHYGEHRSSEELVKLRDALLAARDPAGAAEVGAYISWVLDDAGQTQQGYPYLADSVELVRDAPPSRSKVVVLNLLGAHLAISKDRNEEAASVSGEALAMAEQLGLEELCVQSLIVLGMARGGAEGIADLERGLAIAERIGSPRR
jgi:predicted ATPase